MFRHAPARPEDALPHNIAGQADRSLVYPVGLMDRQTTFLLALGMLIAAALAVGVSGWLLFARDRALVGMDHTPSVTAEGSHHHEGLEGS